MAEAKRRLPVRAAVLGALLVLGAVAFGVAWARGWVSPLTIQRAAREAGGWAMAVYVLAVILGELIWMPRMWGLAAGGLLFGPLLGGLLSIAADLVSASVSYFLARATARAWVARLLGRRPKAERIVRLLAERKGAVTIAVLRVCPVGHFTLVSLAAGLAGVPLRAFYLGTVVGMLPGAVLYPLLGDSISRPTGPVFLVTAALLAAALVVTLRLGKRLLREE